MRYSVRMALWIGFGLVTGLFLIAAIVTVRSVDQVLVIEKQLADLEQAKHCGYLVLADIQEQYIHQAHTIIIGDRSHVGHYREAVQNVKSRIQQLDVSCRLIGMPHGIDEIQNITESMNRYFLSTVLPGLDHGQAESKSKHEYHNQLEQFATRARTQLLELNGTLEKKSTLIRAEHERLLARTQRTTMITLLLALIMAIAVGVAITRMISRPISRMHEAFGRIGAGELETRVLPEGPRELRDLAGGFNQMADDLVDINTRIALNERMAVMGEIAAGVAHELNNPLGVITGYLKLIRKENTNEQTGKDLGIIGDEVQNCKEIVQGLLELSRPQKLDRKDVDLSVLVRDVIERINMSNSDPKAAISLKPMTDSTYVFIDEHAIRRVLNNLLGNALDAAGQNGNINVAVENGGGSITVSVSDSGPGIAPEMRDDLFKPFKTDKPGGTGLGLAISQVIVKSHGGRIDVDAGSLGGARFSVFLPADGHGNSHEENQEEI